MALDVVTKAWVDNYFYRGLGLQLPARYPKTDNDYLVACRRNVHQPIQSFLGKDYDSTRTQEFLKAYRDVVKVTPFHILPLLDGNNSPGLSDWKERIQGCFNSLVKDAELYWCMVKNGTLFKGYVKDGRVIGSLPCKVQAIIEVSALSDTEAQNFVSDLLMKNPLTLTDTECELMRRIFAVDNNYNSRMTKVDVETYHNGEFKIIPVSPIGTMFPPYALRKLWSELPTANPYDSKHKQAYEYVLHNPSGNEELLEYLRPMFENKPTPPAGDYMECEGNLEEVPIPEGRTGFADLGQLLKSYVDDGNIDGCWTIESVINWYSSPDAEVPWGYDPNSMEYSNEMDQFFADVMEHAKRYVNLADLPDVTVDEMVALLRDGTDPVRPEERTFSTVQELLDSDVRMTDDLMYTIAEGNGPTRTVDDMLTVLGYSSADIELIKAGPTVCHKEFARTQLVDLGYTEETIERTLLGPESQRDYCFNYLTEEVGYMDREARDILEGDLPAKEAELSSDRIKAFLLAMFPQYTGDFIDEFLLGNSKQLSINTGTVEQWLVESAGLSQEQARFVTSGTLPSSNNGEVFTDFWTLKASNAISDELRDDLFNSEMIEATGYIVEELKEKIISALRQEDTLDAKSALKSILREQSYTDSALEAILDKDLKSMLEKIITSLGYSDSIKKIFQGDNTPFVKEQLVSVGFDEAVVDEIILGNLPMADKVDIHELQSNYDPFNAVLNSTDLPRVQALIRVLMQTHYGMDADKAYLVATNKIPDPFDAVIESTDAERQKWCATQLTAKIMGIEPKDVHFEKNYNAGMEGETIQLQAGVLLMRKMRAKLDAIDKLPVQEAMKKRGAYVPLFSALVALVGSKADGSAIPMVMSTVLKSDQIDSDIRQMVQETIDFVEQGAS